MSTVDVTLETLVNRTLVDLIDPQEQGLQAVMGSTALDSTGATSVTLSDASGVNVSDVIEWGDELVLVTAKSEDVTPVLTVSRGYFNTTPETHAAGAVGHVNPPYSRHKVTRALTQAFARLEALGVPLVKSTTLNTVSTEFHAELPADCREVLQVWYYGADGRFWELGSWEDIYNLPTTVAPSGKALNVGRYVDDADDLQVVYRAAYRWSNHPTDPVGSDTITVPEGAEDLACLYAVAWLMSSREVSRADLDRSEEWQRTEQSDRRSSSSLVRARWQEFYRALDEARRLNYVPTPMRFKGQPTF